MHVTGIPGSVYVIALSIEGGKEQQGKERERESTFPILVTGSL